MSHVPSKVVTQLPGMDSEPDMVLGSKKEQAELLTSVLKASDDDADEEVIQPSVSIQTTIHNQKQGWMLCSHPLTPKCGIAFIAYVAVTCR